MLFEFPRLKSLISTNLPRLISLFLLFLLAGLIKSLILGFDIVSAFLRVVKFSVFIWLYKQRERES